MYAFKNHKLFYMWGGEEGRSIWKAFVFLVAPVTFKRCMIIEKLIICNYFQRTCRCNNHFQFASGMRKMLENARQ
jgi:hypothetical protein